MTKVNRAATLFEGQQQTAEEAVIARMTALSGIHCAESRAADIVADKVMRGRYRYNPGLGWLAWNGCYWDTDPTTLPRIIDTVRTFMDTAERDYRVKVQQAQPLIAALRARVAARVPEARRTNNRGRRLDDVELFEAHASADEKEQYKDLRHAEVQAEMFLNLLSNRKINAVVTLCQGMPGVVTCTMELDAHDDLFNCANGILDLRTGELMPSDPDMLFTRVAGEYRGLDFRCDVLDKALEAVPPGELEWYRWRLGQAMTGHVPDDDCLVLEQGEGENGKTGVKLAALRAFGNYARMISHRVLTASSDAHPTELMDLRGLRLAILEETPEEGRLDPHRIKMTIGTEFITARLMRKDDVTFKTSHSLFITSNYWPQVDTTDHGTWRKLKGMIWPYRYLPTGQEPTQDHERVGDRTIKHKLRTDPDVPSAMLAFATRGARDWYANGQMFLPDPPGIKEATEEWRKSCDVGYQFAVDYLMPSEDHYVTGTVMKAEFDAFLISQGKKKWSSQLFNTRAASSMLAAGIRVVGNPRTPQPVDELAESFPGLPRGVKPDITTTKLVRMWRGVRFNDETPHTAGVVGASSRSALQAVRDQVAEL